MRTLLLAFALLAATAILPGSADAVTVGTWVNGFGQSTTIGSTFITCSSTTLTPPSQTITVLVCV